MDKGIDVGKIDWTKLSSTDLNKYVSDIDALLCNIQVPRDALWCRYMNCKDDQHGKQLCSLYEAIVQSLKNSSRSLYKHRTKVCNAKLVGRTKQKSSMQGPEMLLKNGLSLAKAGMALYLKIKNALMLDLKMHFATSKEMKT